MLKLVNNSEKSIRGLQEAASEVLNFRQDLLGYITKLYNHSSLFEGLQYLHDSSYTAAAVILFFYSNPTFQLER